MGDAARGRRAAERDRVLAWLDGRANFERLPPRTATLGLTRMRGLLRALGNPQRRFPIVHVAGTKGKGSTVAMLAEMLQAAGHRVGRYMSPHVHALEERVCVAGRPISAGDLVAACDAVIPAVQALDAAAARRGVRGPTWFESLTAAALVHFAAAGVEIAVLETGLGGRLDATNVCHPLVTVITSISLDHMAVLGPTISKIASEKAGIIKRGRPVISGALHPAARRVIAATAARRRAPLVQLGRDFTAAYLPPAEADGALAAGWLELSSPRAAGPTRYRLAMPGRHQAENAALAVVCAQELDARGISVPAAAIDRGLARARLPARIERRSERPLVVVDAAHNTASMAALGDALAPALRARRPRVLVFAASADKQIEEMLASIRGCFDRVVVTRYSTNPRCATIERLVAACAAAGLPRPTVASAPPRALAMARSLAGRDGMVCVAGSFFLAAEVGGG